MASEHQGFVYRLDDAARLLWQEHQFNGVLTLQAHPDTMQVVRDLMRPYRMDPGAEIQDVQLRWGTIQFVEQDDWPLGQVLLQGVDGAQAALHL